MLFGIALLSYEMTAGPDNEGPWKQGAEQDPPITPSHSQRTAEASSEAVQNLRELFKAHPDFPYRSFAALRPLDPRENHELLIRSKAAGLVPQLSRGDCLTLIKNIQTGSLPEWFLANLYRRLGELDHEAAFSLLGGVSQTPGPNSREEDFFTAIIEGWSNHDPARAWRAYQSHLANQRENDPYPRTTINTIFRNWSSRNPQEAFREVKGIGDESFEVATKAYLHGLPSSTDFPSEANRIADLIGQDEKELRLFYGQAHQITNLFAAKWMSQDSDAATQYWLEETAHIRSISHPHFTLISRNPAGRLSTLINHWVFHLSGQDPTVPDKAIRWLKENQDILQSSDFQRRGFAAIAKKAPEKAIELIRELGSKDQQTKLLLDGLRYLSSADTPFEPCMSRAFTPEMVEAEIATGRFSKEQVKCLHFGIERRLEEEELTGR